MTIGKRWLVLGIPLGVLALPVLFVAIVLAYGWFSDTTNRSLTSSGDVRRYLLYVPKTYDPSRPAPLILSLHPAATWPAFERNISGWNKLADRYGVIVAYPAGTGAFSGPAARGQLAWLMDGSHLPREIRFLSDLIDTLEAQFNIDRSRVYANGMSNGGGMAFALACALPERIAAVGLVSPALPVASAANACAAATPMPMILFHGTADRLAPFAGGPSPIAPRMFANIRNWARQVARHNGCGADPATVRAAPHVDRISFEGCAGNADVTFYVVNGGGHTWPGGAPLPAWLAGPTNGEIDATRITWDFFSRHPLASATSR